MYWNIQLDQDLLNTIISIYPEWFKGLKPTVECNMAQGGSSAGTSTASVGGGSSQTVLYPRSPPKAEVDDSPLQKSMDRNKECEYLYTLLYSLYLLSLFGAQYCYSIRQQRQVKWIFKVAMGVIGL